MSMENFSLIKVKNRGAYKIFDNFLTNSELKDCINLALEKYSSKKRTVAPGSGYGDIEWFKYELEKDNLAVCKFLSKFKISVKDITLCVIYYLEPNASLHPHRDLTGASVNNRIRFHIPLITNDKIEFMVDNKKVVMNVGDLWILDTSFKHSVFNGGTTSRAHIIIECRINDHIKKFIFSDFKSKIHTFEFFIWGLKKFIFAILINIIKNPKYFRGQMRMVIQYIYKKVMGKY
jgi:hypothetical protein